MNLAPQLLSGYAHMWDLFETTTFTPIERQVVYMTANFENECNYCVAWHGILANKVGMEPTALAALRSGVPLAGPPLEALPVFRARLLPTAARRLRRRCRFSSTQATPTCRRWR